MVKMDYGSLPHEKSIKWNVALSQTCLRLSQEMSLLHHQLSSLVDRNKESADCHERDEFAKSTFPLIKKQGHRLFTKVIFPSNGEVTTTMPTALTGFGLSSTCAFANFIFDEIVFKLPGSTNSDSSSSIELNNPPHPYDTAPIRADLWFNYGIGSFTVKEVGRLCNTITNICRDATSKWPLCTLPHSLPLSLFISIASFYLIFF